MTPIRIQDISKFYGATAAVDHVSLDIQAGELFFLLGPSGCGKTTLLRILAGFVVPDSGEVYFGDEKITSLPPRLRDAGMVFQTYALWPHLSVAENVAYGLRVRGVARAELKQRVEQALKMVRLEGLGERKPTQLSGGQQQRVALARSLVIQPRVLLLDEPLSNLDARLRDEMREEIRRLHDETGLTMIYVTHDQKEALALADRLALMNRGKLVQVGAPREVYDRPIDQFVAGFLGESNFIPGTVRECRGPYCVVDTVVGQLSGTAPATTFAADARVVCSIRPHVVKLGQGENQMSGAVERLSFLGELAHLQVMIGNEQPLTVTTLPQHVSDVKAGETIHLSVPPEHVVLLAAE